MTLDSWTLKARALAHGLRRRMQGERQGLSFRVYSTFWRLLRAFHLRVFRRQPPLLLVLDGPARLSGFGAITGWAISRDAFVTHVELLLGDQVLSTSTPGDRRHDIPLRFPHYRSRGPQGFRLAPPPGRLPDGTHAITLRAHDARGRVAELRTTVEVRDYHLADEGELPAHLHGSDREYQLWRRDRLTDAGIRNGPRISVVMPIYRPEPDQVRAAIASVRAQAYENWELCLCDDGSQQADLQQYLQRLADSDARVRWKHHSRNRGIAAASNTAIGLASGEYTAFLDQDDELAPEALAAVTDALAHQRADVLYSDWDRIDSAGCYVEPFFKPDWSPDLLQSMMYLAHLTVYRRAFLDRTGLCRSEFDGTQDWELALRASRQTDRIVHIPEVLYHWRLGGTSAGAEFNRICHERGRQALVEHLRGILPAEVRGAVEDGPSPCTFHTRYRHDHWPLVSILIPTRDNHRLLRRCVHSIHRLTDYPHFEILLVDNGSRERGTRRYLRRSEERVVRLDEAFNHSRLNNMAARLARGQILLLLNDDTEVINRGWLQALVEQTMRTEVGAVGAWLFHPDERIQHAGIVLGLGPVARPLHTGILRDGLDRGTARLIRNVSAVTGACLMIRKDLFLQMGGLDETHLPTSFNDVDLCLRLRRAGYRIIQQPLARLYHHESASRRIGDEAAFIGLMHKRWGSVLARDPYWNRNLSGTPSSGFAFHWEWPGSKAPGYVRAPSGRPDHDNALAWRANDGRQGP
jgi:GT2 family glycosyltransferase